MFQLLLAILAIAIFAGIMGIGMGWVTPGVAIRESTSIVADAGFRSMELAATAYRIDHGGAPVPQTAPAVGADPLAPLVPGYAESPSNPSGMVWSYGSENPGQALWVCLSGEAVSAHQWQGLLKSLHSRPIGSAALDNACRAPTSNDGTYEPIAPSAYPAAAALTYRIF